MTSPVGSLLPPHVSRWREGAVVATAYALCLLGGALHLDDTLAPPPLAAYVVGAVSSALLPLRHRSPVAAVAATTACGMLVAPLGLLLSPLALTPAVISAYSLAVRAERRPAAAVLLPASVLPVAVAPFFESSFSGGDVSRAVTVVAAPLVAGVLGHATQNRRAYLAAVEERARRAEQTRESEARHRVAEERVRIARELHDLVAHQITLANAQASVALHVFDARPEQARASLRDLVDTTRAALDDLRATVGLLRQTGDPATAEPAPGLERVPALVESFDRAGLAVSVDHDGPPRPLPPGVDLTAYRIIQEALTNVAKHAGTGSARVGLTWRPDRVTITVADDGQLPAADGPADRSAGHGLIGMRERVTAVGGRLSAGRRPEGGFLVSADLPLPPADELSGAATRRPIPDDGTPDDGEDGEVA